MEKFTLFADLLKPKTTKFVTEQKSKEASLKGIRYQQYEVDVAGRTVTVSIPLKESANFEEHLLTFTNEITNDDLKLMLRRFRGIRG